MLSSQFKELSFKCQKQLEVAKNWLKLKHSTNLHMCGIRSVTVNKQIKHPRAVFKDGPNATFRFFLSF